MRPSLTGTAAALTTAFALAAPAAEAAPRLGSLTVPSSVAGDFTRPSGSADPTCAARGPVSATFSSGTAGALYVIVARGTTVGVGRAPIRSGAIAVDLLRLTPLFNGPGIGYAGPLRLGAVVPGEPTGPFTTTWRLTLVPTDRFGVPGAPATRSIRVTCTWPAG